MALISEILTVRNLQWICSRVAVIYLIIFLFSSTCVDMKMLEMRTKTRHLNDSIPDFSAMINYSRNPDIEKPIDWRPYEKYFELILSYMPDDLIARQLMGYIDYCSGKEQKAIDLFKSSADIKGQPLFWPNYNLGVIYYKKGNFPQAAEYLLKAIGSSPKLTVYLMQNSIMYKQISASPSFKYSFGDEIMDAQSKAYILLLSSLHSLRQYDKMVYISNLAIANMNLSYKDAFYYYAGLGFLEMGQMDKAYLLFQKSITIEKNDPDVYYYIANIYQNAGQTQQAKEFLQASYTLHQKNDPRFPYESKVNLRFF